jgi:hypothetical protein
MFVTLENIEYEMRLETPTLDHYRLDWTPSPEVRLGGMWVPGIVTDQTGQSYLGLRGLSDFIPGMTHTVSPFCGFRALRKNLHEDPAHLYSEYATHDWFEPFQYDGGKADLRLTYDSGRIVRDAGGLHWSDADGRWELHGATVSDIFVLRVPVQDGIEHEVYYRHELIKAYGEVNGISVDGYLHQDYCYGPPGFTYTQLPIARQLEGLWFSWIHEYENGDIGGGCFWQGRGHLDFRPGYLLEGGTTTAHGDVETTLTFTEERRPLTMQVTMAGQLFDFSFESAAGPLHSVGRLVKSSSGQEPVRSWCWIEYAEDMLTPEILDLMTEKFQLVWAR